MESNHAQRLKEQGVTTTKKQGGRCGTRYWYIHGNCRCDECKKANAEEQRRMSANRKKRLQDGTANVEHGKPSTYINWGCRCDPCKEAHSEQMAARWQAKQDEKV